MKQNLAIWFLILAAIWGSALSVGSVSAASPGAQTVSEFPRDLQSYGDTELTSIAAILIHRIRQEPFNLFATLIFCAAIVHTFLTGTFMAVAHRWEHEHDAKIQQGRAPKNSVHHGAEVFHFLGEVEVVFGIWALALAAVIAAFHDWPTLVYYISHKVNFTEALFVVVIMTLAATRPILKLAEGAVRKIANLTGGSLTAWWFTILALGPILGSFITEPAAMTICALLLGDKFYELNPSRRFKYSTLGLLFVNISVGGTLTSFAAPPVLMVAAPWRWDTVFMLTHFGWKAVIGIVLANGFYLLLFRKELESLQAQFALKVLKDKIQATFMRRGDLQAEFEKIGPRIAAESKIAETLPRQVERLIDRIKKRLEARYLPQLLERDLDESMVRQAFDQRFEEIRLAKLRELMPGLLSESERPPFRDPDWDKRDDPVPVWVTAFHVLFMAWTIFNAHHPSLFVPGLLFFLGFAQVTQPFQNRIDLKPPLLVGFFLAGLVVHGGVQGWWIEPVLGNLREVPLMLGATILTAFNDNAAITFLSTLVPGFTDSLKYAVVAGAVAGGGLTVIANAPNPAGLSLLKKHFKDEVSPLGILLSAASPTAIVWGIFLILR
jgi:hypothetical protein